MRNHKVVAILGSVFLLISSAALADVKVEGQISGVVLDQEGQPLPGATVTLIGDKLIQKSITQTSNEKGLFRFLNLKPGDYTVTVSLPGFAGQEISVAAGVGKTSNLQVKLSVAGAAEQVTVRGEAPLIDTTSPKISFNLTARELQQLPNDRSFVEAVEVAPGVHDRAAFGAGGNVEGYDIFGSGAATNSYQLNGVNVNSIEFGNTWVNPNYDTIQEIQIVGPGASAEYGNYTGASINIVTKSGSSAFHGGFTGFYTDEDLEASNAPSWAYLGQHFQGQGDTKRDYSTSAYLGGPLIKEKIHFFVSAAYANSATAPRNSRFYDDQTREHYQIRLDFLASTRNTISAMYDREPILDEDLGLQPHAGPEIGYFRDWITETGYLTWQSVLGNDTFAEIKYAGVRGDNLRIPNASLDIPTVNNITTGQQYNSVGFQRKQFTKRDQGIATVTHYADNFLGTSHDFKAGVEYEQASATTDFTTMGNTFMYIIELGGGLNYLLGIMGYNTHVVNVLERPGVFIQDKVAIGKKLTLNVGLRYDRPQTLDDNTGNTLLEFDQWAPRVGLSYDFAGDGKTVAHAAYGRYYEKVPTYGVGTYAGTGFDPITYYGVVTDQPLPDPTNYQAFRDLIFQPENITSVFDAQQRPVADGIDGPKSDVFNASIERQLGSSAAVSLSYIHKEEEDFVVLRDAAPHTWEPFEYVHPFNNRALTIYRRTDTLAQDFFLGNSDYYYRRLDSASLQFRVRPTNKWFLNSSVTWERARGTRENNECGILSICAFGQDANPNVAQNPFWDVVLAMNRDWVFKLLTGYQLPWGFNVTVDYRWEDGRPWGAVDYYYNIPGANDSFSFYVALEPQDARRSESSHTLNARIGKRFDVGVLSVEVLADVLNALNDEGGTYFPEEYINAVCFGDPERSNCFGKPGAFREPRELRLGLRLTF